MSLNLRECNFNTGGGVVNTVINGTQTLNIFYPGRVYSRTIQTIDSQSSTKLIKRLASLQKRILKITNDICALERALDYDMLTRLLREIHSETLPLAHRLNARRRLLQESRDIRLSSALGRMNRTLDEFLQNKKRTSKLWYRRRYSASTTELVHRTCKRLILSQHEIKSILCDDAIEISRILDHQIEIVDFFAQNWSLPQDLCLNRQAFLSILLMKYRGGPAENVILANRVGILRRENLQLVTTRTWEATIESGDDLQLSVFVGAKRQSATSDSRSMRRCPKCGFNRHREASRPDSNSDWVDCPQCNSSFNRIPSENGDSIEEIFSPESQGLDAGSPPTQPSIFKFYSIITPIEESELETINVMVTVPQPYQTIQIPNVYQLTPSCPTSPSLMPMISRRSHPAYQGETAVCDYIPNDNFSSQAYQLEASLQSSEFLRSMFSVPVDPRDSLHPIHIPQDASLQQPHPAVSPITPIVSPSSPADCPVTPSHSIAQSFGVVEPKTQADLDLQMQHCYPTYWDPYVLWPTNNEISLADDFDLSAVPPIELGKFAPGMAFEISQPYAGQYGEIMPSSQY